ncbi:ABC transporter ATP-binding protein [Candidatus Poribacteria bacterium]|nr:ABC transporter ATP-binding protein [Candidatus Poribacteria bacterium]
MLAVEVADLSYAYGEREALRKVSFGVPRGSVFGIVGPNGSGKSTFFKTLATLLRPTTGNAIVFGDSVLDGPARVRQHIGVVFQESGLDGKLTLEENLHHHARLFGMRRARRRERIDTVLDRTGLDDRRRDLVEELSGGLRRRGDVAQSLLHEPKLLLLDEPSTGLDPVARRELWRYLDEIRAERDLTILVTTHLMDEADRCDELALLHRGELVALASPQTLKDEMGYDVITIHCEDAGALSRSIRDRFPLEPRVKSGTIRIEVEHGHRWIAKLVEAFPDTMDSVNLSKPSIEDVFVTRTGASIVAEDAAGASA